MDSIRNFRSLGGIKTKYGTVKPKLFRGGPTARISEVETTIFHETLNITQVLDLRSLEERTSEPNTLISNVENITLQLMPEITQNSADPADIMQKLVAHDYTGFMIPMYESFITSEFSRKAHKRFLELIASNEGATYFHCTAGKDRTGYSAALLLKILGADNETIMDEYLLTNKQKKEHMDELVERTRKRSGNIDLDDDAIMALVGVHEGYLNASFDTINTVYGSFELYLKDGLQVEDELIASLRSSLLE